MLGGDKKKKKKKRYFIHIIFYLWTDTKMIRKPDTRINQRFAEND